MTPCACHPDLQSYHDGEMEPSRREALQQHVSGCDECSRELRQLRNLSGLLAIPESEDMTDAERARLHQAMDDVIAEDEPRTLRFPWFKAVAAAAASILVIAGAWMMQAPVAPGTASINEVATGPTQNDWMRIAVTLQVDPPPPGLGEPGLADSQTANWFLENLDGKAEHASN